MFTNKQKGLQGWLWLALTNLLLATSIGALLRYAFVEEVSWLAYRNFLHGHSHVAMLGWVGQGLFILLIGRFTSDLSAQRLRPYHLLLGLAQLSIWGMLISFPLNGYSSGSIVFSTLNILTSYGLIYLLRQDITIGGWPGRFLAAAFFFLVLSTLPLWGMGPLILLEMEGTALYYAAIQFFLHFQFNGWFIFALLALLFAWLQRQDLHLDEKSMRWFWGLLLPASVLTYALAVAWSTPLPIVFGINSTGVVIQGVALFFLVRLLRKSGIRREHFTSAWRHRLLYIAFLSYAAKVVVQTLVVLPFIAEAAYTIRNYVIGFVHLLQLGIFTAAILAFAHMQGLLDWQKLHLRLGLSLLFLGFFLSEALLFLQGTMFWGAKGFLPYYYELLFVTSALMPLGILLLVARQPFMK